MARARGEARLNVDVAVLAGPLPHDQLRWVADLYGRADPKYLRDDVLEHLYLRSPAGPGLHAFALDGGRPVGHSSIVPMRGRRGRDELLCGKLEAIYVDKPYRGRQPDGRTVVRSLLDALYAFAFDRGIVLLHAYATPLIGRVIAFDRLPSVGERSFVALFPSAGAAAVSRAAAGAQGAARVAAGVVGHDGDAVIRDPRAADSDLVDGALPAAGRWTISAADAWEWYSASPLVRVRETWGSDAGRALIQIPASPLEPLRLVGWRPERSGLRAAVRLLNGLARLAEGIGARSLRFQPWESRAANGDLRRACRLLGFIRRDDFTTLYVHTRDPELARADAVVTTPLLYLGF